MSKLILLKKFDIINYDEGETDDEKIALTFLELIAKSAGVDINELEHIKTHKKGGE